MKKAALLTSLISTMLIAEPPPQPPPKDPDLFLKDKAVLSSHFEFLYWEPLESTLLYALNVNGPSWNPNDTYAVGDYEHATYSFDPGFRITLGYFRAPRYWELFGSYTRLTARGKDSITAPSEPNQFLTAAWPTYFQQDLSLATSSIHLNYNVVDLHADRYFIPNPHLRLRLIAGFTGAWMDQSWTVKYYDFSNHVSLVRNRWKFGGAGFRVGMMADWFWTDNIYITLRGSIAMLTGAYKNTAFQTTSIKPSDAYNPSFPIRNSAYRDSRAVANLQLMIGPSWQKSWERVRTELFAGYEISSWMNLQEVYYSNPAVPAVASQQTNINNSVLTLQGLTTRFSLDF